jgi:hypothetical protein
MNKKRPENPVFYKISLPEPEPESAAAVVPQP